MDLDESLRVEGAAGKYRVRLADSWEAFGPNGGYLAALALRAAGEVAQIKRPASFYCHFLSVPRFDMVDLEVTVLKQGRRSESLSVQMLQQGKVVLSALVRTAVEGPGYQGQHTHMPSVARPEGLKNYAQLWPDASGPRMKVWSNMEGRPTDQSTLPVPREAKAKDWVRFQPRACFDDIFVDAARSLILLDMYGWPAAYRAYLDDRYRATSLDISTWFHQFAPRSEWLLVDHECLIANDGLIGVDGKVWDNEGRLLAMGSAHLMCLPAPSLHQGVSRS